MSERAEKDRWNELAELLGLPPDEKKSEAAAPPPPAPPPPAAPVFHHEQSAPELPEAVSMETETFEPAEIMEAPAMQWHEATEPEPVKQEPALEEESPDHRRGGRRRGRRGQRDDGGERNHHRSKEDASHEEKIEVEASEPKDDDRHERGRGRGRPSREEEPASRDFPEEEIVEPEEVEYAEPVAEEDDDEEIDKLTDWSVPSWSELIGSLYRPER